MREHLRKGKRGKGKFFLICGGFLRVLFRVRRARFGGEGHSEEPVSLSSLLGLFFPAPYGSFKGPLPVFLAFALARKAFFGGLLPTNLAPPPFAFVLLAGIAAAEEAADEVAEEFRQRFHPSKDFSRPANICRVVGVVEKAPLPPSFSFCLNGRARFAPSLNSSNSAGMWYFYAASRSKDK